MITITNLNPDLTIPLTESIDAQTAFMEANAACQAAGIEAIYNTPLCDSGEAEMIAELSVRPEPCCRMIDLVAEGTASGLYGDDVESAMRETCSDGSITDMVTYTNGDECSYTIATAGSPGGVLSYDENCEPILVDVDCNCKPQIEGEPYSEYFIPAVSDYGNQIYCVAAATYAFAWSGVTNNGTTGIKEFLEQNADSIDLEDPTNPYVAVVGGEPYACGGYDPELGADVPAGTPIGTDGSGDPVYFFPSQSAFGHTVSDINAIQDNNPGSTVALDANLDTIRVQYHPLQVSQSNRLRGCYSPVQKICPEWSGEPPDDDPGEPTGGTGEGEENNGLGLGDLNLEELNCDAPDIEGKNAASAYALLWKDWWEQQKRKSKIQNVILGAQGFGALAALIESIRIYNRLLDKNLDIICNVRDDVTDLRACSAQLLDAENGIIKECQMNLLADHNNRIGTINNRGVFACEFADNEVDCYEKLWQPLQNYYTIPMADKLKAMYDAGGFSADRASDWAATIDECIEGNMLPEIKRLFNPILGSASCPAENLNDWRQDLKDKTNRLYSHFEQTYQSNEASMIPAIMDMSTCMIQRACEMRNWLEDCAKLDQDIYKKAYQSHEEPQAHAAMTAAAEVLPQLIESVKWLETNVPAALDIFKTCFSDEQRTLNPLLFNNARELAPELQKCFEWFKENARCYTDFFDKCYKDGECRLVSEQLEFAYVLTKQVREVLCDLENWAKVDRDFYDENFRHVEQLATPDLVWNGNEASNDLDDFRKWWIERTEQFRDIWETHWLPCDIENLKQHCDVWSYTNPLREIHSNSDQMKLTSLDADEAYRMSIIEANQLLEDTFHTCPETFDYCVETPALLHVRKQIDQQKEDLIKCTPQHCSGWLMEALIRLDAEGARAEGSAYATAERWKWVANEQLDRKAFDRKTQLLQLFDSYGIRGMEANKISTAGHDTLLNHMSGAITRGDKFYSHMQDAGRNAITIMGNELDTMIRMVQLWHFWPEMALNNRSEFLRSSQSTFDDAQQIMQLGHFWPDIASREKSNATQISENAVDVGVRLSQLGQFYLQQAESMNQQRASQALAAGQLGNDFARTGHNLHQLGSNKMQQALGSSMDGARIGIGAGELGNRHAVQALEMENRMTLNALEHLKAGIGALGIGREYFSEVRSGYSTAGGFANGAAGNMLNLFNHGRNNGLLSLAANEQCRDTEFQMLQLAKNFLMQNYQITQGSLHGGTSGTLNATNNLLQQQGNNAGGAFSLLGNSLEGLFGTGSTSAPPFPTGGFGFPGTGTFGFGTSGGLM